MGFPEEAMLAACAAMEQAAERVVITDRKGTILYVNPAFERTTGYSKTEAIGKNPRIVKSGQHDQRFYQGLWKALLSGRSFHARFLNRRKNGELYYEEQTISPLRDGRGEVAYFISTAIDLTPRVEREQGRKLAEESLRRLEEISVSREGRVVELKLEVNALLKELGRAPKYHLG